MTISKNEGLEGLFKGYTISTVGTITSSFSYFYIYGSIRHRVLKILTGPPTISVELLIGAIAGALCQVLVLPLAIVTTREQTKTQDQSLLDTIISIYKQKGILGFWTGLKASLILTSNPAITYGVFERLKGILQRRNGTSLTSIEVFMIGAISKSLATIVTYPYIMAKVKLQSEDTKSGSASQVLENEFKNKGFLGLYQGLWAQILKAVLSQSILFVSKEKLQVSTNLLLVASGVLNDSKKEL